jgi:hypothetical protein
MYGSEQDWPTMASDPTFHLRNVVHLPAQGQTLIQVEFEMGWPASREHVRRIKGGKATFDPDHFWVMQSFDCKVEYWRPKDQPPSVMNVSESYKYTYDGDFPIAEKAVRREKVLGRRDDAFETQDEYHLALEDVPESAFTLSAFGFPEPGAVGHHVPWFLWAALIGLLCLGLAVLLRWQAKRAARPMANP